MPEKQDFIKGWPSAELLEGSELKAALIQSYTKGLEMSGQSMNYGDPASGAYMLGHPRFLQALSGFLEKNYGKPASPKHLMTTIGASMGIDLCIRQLCSVGDVAVVEEPTYYLAHTMIRDRGMSLLGVPMEEDGMDVTALEKHLEENPGKIKLVYTVSVHHNPTGITLSNPKREKLVALAKQHNFVIVSDEAYQLLNFGPMEVLPLFYHDDPEDPHVCSIGTFSKLIGPGVKVGWVQAYEKLLHPLKNVGFIDSGNNPVIFSSCNLIDFLESGACDKHIAQVSAVIGKKCKLMVQKFKELGYEPSEPKGGYFVWVKSKPGGKTTGRSGEAMAIKKDKFQDMMRLCFAWLPEEKIIEGIEYLRE
jgi:DNA-binding transcriptional MocR family regulator